MGQAQTKRAGVEISDASDDCDENADGNEEASIRGCEDIQQDDDDDDDSEERRATGASTSATVGNEFENVQEDEEKEYQEEDKEEVEREFLETEEGNEDARLVAKCDDLCPEEERTMRLARSDFDPRFEGAKGELLMKRFSRTFNGNPEEVRTLDAIEKSLGRVATVIEETIGGVCDCLKRDENSLDFDALKTFSELTDFVRDRSRAIRGDLTAQSASGPKSRRIMRRSVHMMIRFDYEIRKRQRLRAYTYIAQWVKFNYSDPDARRMIHRDHSMALQFREQLGKSLATYSIMCTERAEFVSPEDKAEILSYRLLLRLSAKVEEEEEEKEKEMEGNRSSSSSSSSKLDNIDFRAAELDVLNSPIVSRAMYLSVCVDAGKYVSLFKTIDSESFTFLEFCCVYACLDPLRARYISRSNVSHNRMKMNKEDACSILKIQHVEKLNLLLFKTFTDSGETDIEFSAACKREPKEYEVYRTKLESVAIENLYLESALTVVRA